MLRVHKLAAVVAAAVAVVTWAVDLAEVTWVALAETTWAGSTEVASVASAETTWAGSTEVALVASAEIMSVTWATITLALEDVVSAACTAAA